MILSSERALIEAVVSDVKWTVTLIFPLLPDSTLVTSMLLWGRLEFLYWLKGPEQAAYGVNSSASELAAKLAITATFATESNLVAC